MSMHNTDPFRPRFFTVVVAAGHGCIRPGRSKLLEPVDAGGTPMVVQAVRSVVGSGLGPIALVLNRRFGDDILSALRAWSPEVMGKEGLAVVYQEERRGAADAVRVAVHEAVAAQAAPTFLVVYADMPLWRPETLRALARIHRQGSAPMSMVSVPVAGADTPRILERYGRVLRDRDGRIVNVVEPGEATDDDLPRTASVNPSLYAFDTGWFIGRVGQVRPQRRADGYGDEVHLPPLARIVAEEGHTVSELPLADPEEALGVNTAAELADVRAVLDRRAARGLGVAR